MEVKEIALLLFNKSFNKRTKENVYIRKTAGPNQICAFADADADGAPDHLLLIENEHYAEKHLSYTTIITKAFLAKPKRLTHQSVVEAIQYMADRYGDAGRLRMFDWNGGDLLVFQDAGKGDERRSYAMYRNRGQWYITGSSFVDTICKSGHGENTPMERTPPATPKCILPIHNLSIPFPDRLYSYDDIVAVKEYGDTRILLGKRHAAIYRCGKAFSPVTLVDLTKLQETVCETSKIPNTLVELGAESDINKYNSISLENCTWSLDPSRWTHIFHPFEYDAGCEDKSVQYAVRTGKILMGHVELSVGTVLTVAVLNHENTANRWWYTREDWQREVVKAFIDRVNGAALYALRQSCPNGLQTDSERFANVLLQFVPQFVG